MQICMDPINTKVLLGFILRILIVKYVVLKYEILTCYCTVDNKCNFSGMQEANRRDCTFESRIATTNHPLARTLYELMSSKKTNLCVAADVTTSQELLALADQVCSSLGVPVMIVKKER